MRKLLQVLAALAAFSISSTHAYLIDADCGSDPIWLQRHIDHAFELSANALVEIQKTPIDPQIERVYSLLFGYTPKNRPPVRSKSVEERLTNIAPLAGYGSRLGSQLQSDVKFYCTTKRIQKRADGRFYNKDQDFVYEDGQKTGKWDGCFGKGSGSIYMITTNLGEGFETEIQICPWFLTVERGIKYADIRDVNSVLWGGLHILQKTMKDIVTFGAKKPLDAFQLFDITIVHELTHTTQAGGARDYEYYWEACLDLAKKWVTHAPEAKDPENNADSIALMVSAVEITRAGITIRDDGKLIPPKKKKSSKRDAVMYPVTWVA